MKKMAHAIFLDRSERKPTCEFWSDSGYFSSVIVVTEREGGREGGEGGGGREREREREREVRNSV